ncbi:MAG: hypothetical protein JXA03_15330 [Bacteroidales bacterium]|nr:hypothetical protein [Bacteroidales bacterium]
MKRIIITNLMLVLLLPVFSQPPQAFKYQAVVRNAAGDLIADQNVSFRVSIRDGSPTDAVLYQEIHSAITNQFGLANLLIGEGTPVSGDFTSIDWGSAEKYLKMECDPAGGTAYVEMGTSKLQSVPYALFAGRSNDSFWEHNGNNIFYNNGYVGIGTSNPVAELHVFGGGLFRGDQAGIGIGTGTNVGYLSYTDTYGGFTNMLLQYGKTIFNGTVGIGSTDPQYSALQIEGSATYNGVLRLINTGPGGADFFLGSTSDAWSGEENRFMMGHGTPAPYNADITINEEGKVGIGESTPAYQLHVKGPAYDNWLVGFHNTNTSSAAHGLVVRADGGDPLLVQNSSGTIINAKHSQFVGIHTSTPSTNLVVKSSGYTHGLQVLSSDDDLIFRIRQNSDGSGTAYLYDDSGNPKVVLSPGGISSFMGGKVGIGLENPLARLEVSGENAETGIFGSSGSGSGVWGASGTGFGIYGQSTLSWAGYFSGNVYVSGTLAKGAGSFVIDHPLDPENKLLRHNFVESPENLLIYRGKIQLDKNGKAKVELPDYFVALAQENEATVTLTCIDVPFLTAYQWENNGFIIFGEAEKSVSWVVYADRDDPVIHELGRPVEEEKGGENTLCEKGKLLYPRAYGYPESAGRDYEIHKLAGESKSK